MKPYVGSPMALGAAAGAQSAVDRLVQILPPQREPDPGEEARLCGGGLSVLDSRDRLVCSRCGQHDIDMIVTESRR